MGSREQQFARVTLYQWLVLHSHSTLLARDPRITSGPDQHPSHRMKLLCLFTLFSYLISFTIASPLLQGRVRRGDGYQDVGGVYDSPEAQAYWARRFGGGFFGNLLLLQRSINSAAASRVP